MASRNIDSKSFSTPKIKSVQNILINATGDKIKSNAQLLIFKMKNSFPDLYSDKQHVEHSGNVVFNFDTGIVRTPKVIETDEYKVLSDDADIL